MADIDDAALLQTKAIYLPEDMKMKLEALGRLTKT
ncbi:hypothetical protein LCGC14_2378990 [marine sediment metagenome]|uniref:Uncharacterized protein n=1 Tax=marine sediment metagenome TaxID=412755 RepID=A0A0F9CNP4_9ZZZZ